MVNINLMPWREKRRELKQREFVTASIAVVMFSGLIVLAAYMYFDSEISNQQERNAMLDNEIRMLQQQVAEISRLREQKQQMIDRMGVIQSLQSDRPKIVHVFDQLTRTLPDGVFFKDVDRQGERIRIVGYAESSARISALIRRLESSEWFKDPRPTEIVAAPQYGEFASQFTMLVSIENPNSEDEEEG